MWPGSFTGTFLQKHGLPAADKWYEHEPERVVEKSDEAKFLWDFSIQTNCEIQSRRSDIVFLGKEENQCFFCRYCCASRCPRRKRLKSTKISREK